MCEARRATSLLDLTLGPAGGRRGRSRDSDPTSTSTGTSGFGAYALSGESVVVVVGNYKFAAGLTRKAAPSACTKLSHYPRRSQDTPGVVHPSTLHQMRVAAVISSGSPRFGRPGAGCGMRRLIARRRSARHRSNSTSAGRQWRSSPPPLGVTTSPPGLVAASCATRVEDGAAGDAAFRRPCCARASCAASRDSSRVPSRRCACRGPACRAPGRSRP